METRADLGSPSSLLSRSPSPFRPPSPSRPPSSASKSQRFPPLKASLACLALALLLPHPALASNEQKLEGKWRVVQMVRNGKRADLPPDTVMIMTFQVKGHRWRVDVASKEEKHQRAGTWQLRGDRLTTRTDDNRTVENIRVNFKGTVIELAKQDGTLILEKR